MDNSRSLYGLIAEVIRSETRYLRHFIGQVKDTKDILNKGRVLVIIPILGWDTPARGSWCWPRDKHSMSIPKVDDWVEVYFLNGDRNVPVYLGKADEMLDQTPVAYEGNTDIHVLFESPNNVQKIVYDENGDTLKIGEDEEPFVLGDQLEDYLINIIKSTYNTHTHPYTWTDPGGAGNTSPPNQTMNDPSGILSERIFGE